MQSANGDSSPGAPHVTVRRARLSDVEAVVCLINSHATRGEMLPKSLNQVYQNVRDFVVAERQGQIVGCGALHVLWGNLAEVRSLAVVDSCRRQGIGGLMLQALLRDAERLGVPQVFALTYRPGFFERWGFRTVERESLPRKIWVDCIDCPKFLQCDEVAVLLDL